MPRHALRNVFLIETGLRQVITGWRRDDLIRAHHRSITGLVETLDKARGVAGFRRIKDGSLFDIAAHDAQPGEFREVGDAVAHSLFRPGAAGSEQGAQGGQGE